MSYYIETENHQFLRYLSSKTYTREKMIQAWNKSNNDLEQTFIDGDSKEEQESGHCFYPLQEEFL